MFEQHRFQLERRDPVVRGLEHVVGPTDIGDVAIGVDGSDVAGVILAVGAWLRRSARRRRGSRPSAAPAGRTGRCRSRLRLPPVRRSPRRSTRPVAGHRPAHRALLDRLTRRNCRRPRSSRSGRSRPGSSPPRPRRTCSMTSGLSGSPAPTTSRGGVAEPAQVGLDQHPPDRRRRAEGGDPVLGHHPHQRRCVEPCVVVEEDRRAGQPGREHVGPCVLGPARRGDVQVHVARAQADPVQRRQVPDRVARPGCARPVWAARWCRR